MTSTSNHCPDCGAGVGQLHSIGCDVERCPYCGGQLISCTCDGLGIDEVPDDDRIPWTGVWHGVEEARNFGWFVKPGPKGKGWVPCSKDDPEATEDLNRLHVESKWDRKKKRFV